MKHILQLISLVFLLLVNVSARAETIDCTAITSLPTTITTQGIYCLTGNLSTSITSGNAITINTNNVTLDLNGYKLGGLGAGDSTVTNGIYANQRKNITIKNGIIRGFHTGIYFQDTSPYTTSQGHLVEDVLLDQNVQTGILAKGRGITLRRNQVVDTGGYTGISNASAYGIRPWGPGNDVLNNRVTNTVTIGTGGAYGIYVDHGGNVVIEGNRVSATDAPSGNEVGIIVDDSNDVMVRDNTITEANYGLNFSGSTGKYMGNLTGNIGTAAFTGGTAVGTNN